MGPILKILTVDGFTTDLTLQGSSATTLGGAITVSNNGTTATVNIHFFRPHVYQ